MLKQLALFFFVALSAQAMKLPSYITQCKKSDPKLNDCVLAAAPKALIGIVEGDKQLKLQSFHPLRLEQVDLSASDGLKIMFKNIEIRGLENVRLEKVDIKDNHWEIGPVVTPLVEIVMDYDINGKIMVLPISGKGPGNITLVNPELYMTLDIETVDEGGKKHYKVKDSKVDYKAEKIYFRLEHLFNGNEQMSNEMNTFLNENWKEVASEVHGVITESFNSVLANVFVKLFKNVPADEMFSP